MSLRPGSPLGVGPLGAKQPRLSLRRLGRTTLARQHLLKRNPHDLVELVEALCGLNAQDVYQPYISLWGRLQGFQKGDLEKALSERRLVRATLFRSTLHIVSAKDYLLFRPVIHPVLLRALRSFFRSEVDRLPLEDLERAALELTQKEPRTFPELRRLLHPVAPEASPPTLSFAARAILPLVQVPPAGFWNSRRPPAYVSAEHWLGESLADPREGGRQLVLRYLQAFGPATLADLTAFAGLSLRERVSELKNELVELKGEDGKTYLDLPEAPLVEEEIPAPPRFLPPWDNLLLAHADRARVLPEEYRPRVILKGGRVQATFLLDGFVAGLWRWERVPAKGKARRARLILTPFRPLSPAEKEALEEEGESLLAFLVGETEDGSAHLKEVMVEW